MVAAARGRAAGSGEVGDANVVSGHIKWSETVDPSAVQGIPGVVSENSQPFFVAPRQTDVPSFAAAGCTEREMALHLAMAFTTVRGDLARAKACSGTRRVVAMVVAAGLVEVPRPFDTCTCAAAAAGPEVSHP